MKNLKYLFLALICSVTAFSFVSCDDDDNDDKETTVSFNSLPDAARVFVNTYFANETVTSVKHNPASVTEAYEVRFQSGAEIDFTAAGEWTDVSMAPGRTIPAGIVLQNISDYVTQNFPSDGINEVSKQVCGYEVELVSGIDLYFDLSGGFLRADR